MRHRHVENAEIGLPAMKLEQWIVIAAEVMWQHRFARNGMIDIGWMAGPSTPACTGLIRHLRNQRSNLRSESVT